MDTARFAEEFRREVLETAVALRVMPVSAWAGAWREGGWSRLEILGHLVDSAMNNQQRIVRAAAEGDLVWPGYDQDAMVRVQRYAEASPEDIIALWEHLNLFLARLVGLVPEARLAALCTIGGGAPVTLAFLISDYRDHLRHHLAQIRQA